MGDISIPRKFQSHIDLKPRSQVVTLNLYNEISERSTLPRNYQSFNTPKTPQKFHPKQPSIFRGRMPSTHRALPRIAAGKFFGFPIKTGGKSGAFPQKKLKETHLRTLLWLKKTVELLDFSDPPILLWLLLQGHWPHARKDANFTKISNILDII